MKVLVGSRQSGRTTKLVEWLLDGKEQQGYPQWSRVILCATNNQVIWLHRFIQDEIKRLNWIVECEQCLPHLTNNCVKHHHHVMTQIRKAVWGFNDFQTNARGRRDFEYGIDDAEEFLFTGFVPHKLPSVIVLEGEIWE